MTITLVIVCLRQTFLPGELQEPEEERGLAGLRPGDGGRGRDTGHYPHDPEILESS